MSAEENHFIYKPEYKTIDLGIKKIIKRYTKNYPTDIRKIIKECDQINNLRYENLGEDVSGKIGKDGNGKYTITINDTHHENRKRFTLAHEFAHYLLHKDLIGGDGIIDNALYRSEKSSSSEEVEANRLAADILMPIHHIYELIKKDPSIVAVARELEVSTLALRVRLGILYDNYTDSLEKLIKSIKSIKSIPS